MNHPATQLLTRPEAAKALSVSVRTLDELTRTGDLPHVGIGRSIRFRPSSVDYFIEARESRGKRPVQKAKKKGAAS
jgi:excisionase family DNA binding protein